jgi:predicted ribosome-associated RNA-binding protein Tma20
MDTPNLDKRSENLSIINEVQKYDASIYFSTDEKLITKDGLMLFFKENEKEFPTLSEIAKMIFLWYSAVCSGSQPFAYD